MLTSFKQALFWQTAHRDAPVSCALREEAAAMPGDTKRQITEQLMKILEYMGTIGPFRGGSQGYKHR